MADRKLRNAFRVGKKSLVLVIPPEFAEALKIEPKTTCVIELSEGKMTVANLNTVLDTHVGAL